MAVPWQVQADWVYWEGRLHSGLILQVDDEGRLMSPAAQGAAAPSERCVRLPGRVLLPGLVNAHSHAFQRLLRGTTEHAAVTAETDDFWSWRAKMYHWANALDPQSLFVSARQAFLEMALAGVTAVGEFHYLQHSPDGNPYANRNELALAVVRAAREVGLRICLLRVGYARASFGKPAEALQRRFVDRSPEAWFESAHTLRTALRDDPCVSVGLAPHSVRALPRSWLEALSSLPCGERGPVHMHVAEQPAEVEACLASEGLRPVELLEQVGILGSTFTAVHGIEVTADEIARLGRSGSGVCACPLTERNLGDGVVPADALQAAGVRICLGTDSQAQIDLLEEARTVEMQLRLVRGRRAVLDRRDGRPEGLSQSLLEMATVQGARSLSLDTGLTQPGRPADFFTLDLNHPTLAGASEAGDGGALLQSLVFGAPSAAVRDVAVAGRWIVRDGRHERAEQIVRDYAALVRTMRER